MIKWKKLLAMLVCMAMVLSFVPAASFASEGEASVQSTSYRDWKQYKGPWADYIMGGGSAKVRNYGCTSVSFAIIAVQLGCESESNFDPGVFVNRMNKIGGYTSGGAMSFSKKNQAIPNLSSIKDYYFSSESNEYRIGIIDQYRQQGYAVMIRIHKYGNKYHYVVADYVSNGELFIIDPGYSNGNIKNNFSGAEEMIDEIYIYGR